MFPEEGEAVVAEKLGGQMQQIAMPWSILIRQVGVGLRGVEVESLMKHLFING